MAESLVIKREWETVSITLSKQCHNQYERYERYDRSEDGFPLEEPTTHIFTGQPWTHDAYFPENAGTLALVTAKD